VGTYWHSFSRPRELETTTFHFAFDLGEIDMIGWIPLELRIWGWTDKRGLEKIEAFKKGDGAASRLELNVESTESTKARSSEFIYDVDYLVDAVITLEDSKLDIYASNLRSIMADLIHAIDDSSHAMRVTLDNAIEAVRTAERATRFAHP